MTATIEIGDNEITPKTDIRILGLQIDTKLKWATTREESLNKDDQTDVGADTTVNIYMGGHLCKVKATIMSST